MALSSTPSSSGPRKRSLTIAGHRTSISLEESFWRGLKEVADGQGRSVPEIVAEIDSRRGRPVFRVPFEPLYWRLIAPAGPDPYSPNSEKSSNRPGPVQRGRGRLD